jgi:beta-glucuronidase
MLKPQATSTRELISLDGLWKFALVTGDIDSESPWTKTLDTTLEAPVPASYNDIFIDPKIHDHVGWVCYQRRLRVPRGWSDQERYFIRIEAATHQGRVYVDDKVVVEHIGGYTPFDAEITTLVKPGDEFRLTIAVNNELTNITIPPGAITVTETGARKQTYYHDFYNYAGLARSVWLYSVPVRHIEDVTISTDVQGLTGIIRYSIKAATLNERVKVNIFNEDEKLIAEAKGFEGEIKIKSANLWQPGAAYLYQFKVSLQNLEGELVDSYSVATGIRRVEVRGNKFLINNKPFYFTGFGRHEDTAIRGKCDPVEMSYDATYTNHTVYCRQGS